MVADPSVKSAARVFEILKQFERLRKPLRLKDITAQAGYPTSSTAALLKSMTAQGYLSFSPRTRCYFPTEQLAQLVSWLSVAAYESETVNQALTNIQHSTREYVALGTIADIHVEFVEALRSSYDLQYWNPTGTKRLLIQSGMGWLLLGQQSKTAVTRIYKRTIEAGGVPERKFSIDDLWRRIEQHRARDFSFTKPTDFVQHPAQEGVGMIAMLVPLPPNHRPLVIGVGGPADRLKANLKSIVDVMRDEVAHLDDVTSRVKRD